MHDLISVDPFNETPSSSRLASIVCDLSADLNKLLMVVMADEPTSGHANLDVRHDVQRLLEYHPSSPAELDMTQRALDLLQDVLGVESDCHRTLARHLGRPKQKDDPIELSV